MTAVYDQVGVLLAALVSQNNIVRITFKGPLFKAS